MRAGASLASRWAWMSQHAPAFPVCGHHIKVLSTPEEFYQTLKAEAEKAKKRIVISSLYLGTGELEQGLVNSIHSSQSVTPDRRVHVLLDYTRGSRGKTNSRTLLLPLLKDFAQHARVSLYHTPDLRGILKRVAPERYDETVGVQHMKIYLFDDNLVISGANLSDSYFTNRQDRYLVICNAGALGDFCEELVNAVGSFSFQLDPDDGVTLLPELPIHPYADAVDKNGDLFKREARHRVQSVLESAAKHQNDDIPQESEINDDQTRPDTWIFPLVQMGPFKIDVDHTVTTTLFRQMEEGSRIRLASGYFNMTEQYISEVINWSRASYDILTAAPQANGFYQAAGVAGAIPDAYTVIARQFLERVRSSGQQSRIQLSEFHRPGWTFHGKGLWGYLPGEKLPSVTLMGSPNFGHRSVYRDLELQLAIITGNHNLQKQLHQEQEQLYQRSEVVSTETLDAPGRRPPLWVRLATNFIKNFF